MTEKSAAEEAAPPLTETVIFTNWLESAGLLSSREYRRQTEL